MLRVVLRALADTVGPLLEPVVGEPTLELVRGPPRGHEGDIDHPAVARRRLSAHDARVHDAGGQSLRGPGLRQPGAPERKLVTRGGGAGRRRSRGDGDSDGGKRGGRDGQDACAQANQLLRATTDTAPIPARRSTPGVSGP